MNSVEVIMMRFKAFTAATVLAVLCMFPPVQAEERGEKSSVSAGIAGAAEAAPLFESFDVYVGTAVKESRKESESDRELKADAGLAASVGNLDLLLSFGLPYGDSGLLWDALSGGLGEAGAFALDAGIRRCGISFYVDSIGAVRLPCLVELCGGTLRFAGGLSRLKKPCLSAPWNYGTLTLLRPGLASSLPTFTSSSSPMAFSVRLAPPDWGLPLPCVELAVTQEGEAYASVYKDLPVFGSKSSLVYLAATAGAFVYGGRELKSWFYTEPYYRERSYLSADAEAGFRLEKALSANFAAGFSENPHGGLGDVFFWRRGQVAVSFWRMGLTASCFDTGTPDMILPGGSRLNRKSRVSVNPSVKIPLRFLSGNGTLSLALLGMKDVKLVGGEERDSFCHGLKGRWSRGRFSATAQYTDSFPERDGGGDREHTRKLGLSIGCRRKAFRSSSSVTVKLDGKDGSFTVAQRLYPSGGGAAALSSVLLGGGAYYEDGSLDRIKLSVGADFLFRTRKACFRGKLLYSSTFCGEF